MDNSLGLKGKCWPLTISGSPFKLVHCFCTTLNNDCNIPPHLGTPNFLKALKSSENLQDSSKLYLLDVQIIS